jgi:anaerobic selenocysteine-containing dehydrogenase
MPREKAHKGSGRHNSLLYPQIRDDRRSNTWRRVSWDEALDFIVKRMRKVGPEAVGLWAGHGGFTPGGSRLLTQLQRYTRSTSTFFQMANTVP